MMDVDILGWIVGQILSLFVAISFGVWMGHIAPGMVVWSVLTLLVDIRRYVSK
jgi:hypothetical protein